MTDDSTAKVARDAAVQSFVSNAVYLALMVAAVAALSRRDWLARQAMRARAILTQQRNRQREIQALAELRRDISRMEHEGPG
jgi:hypothetical protein